MYRIISRLRTNFLFLVTLIVTLFLVGCNQQAQTPSPAPTTIVDSSPVSTTAVPADPKSAAYGAKTAALNTSWTLEEMLQYAIEDEYLARGEYDYVIKTFGAQNPFTNIIAAEETHISYMKGLYTTRNISLPADNSAQYLVKPATVKEGLALGVEAEIANINMYKNFLNTPNLPDDVKTVFTQLKAGSESHLNAFQRGLNRY